MDSILTALFGFAVQSPAETIQSVRDAVKLLTERDKAAATMTTYELFSGKEGQ